MEKKDLDDLAYTSYLRAFARIASGATGGFSAADLTVTGEAKVTLALVLGILDGKATPPTLAKRAEFLARLEDNLR